MINIPERIKDILDKIKTGYSDVLRNNLVGIYIHGSIAMNCFNHRSSDVDFLAVVKEKLDLDSKKKIIKLLLDLSDQNPVNGLEMSIVLQAELKDFKYPTPYELHYSNEWKQRYINGTVDYSKDDADPDLAAHLVIVKKRGICLSGKPIREVFFEVPKKYYLKSILTDSEWSIGNILKGPDTGTCPVPTYGVLNLCRVLAFIDDGIITSKKEGGEWGLGNLPTKYRQVIERALNKYTGTDAAENVDAETLKQFAIYAKSKWTQ
ncbi:DUF4111 domain-containing protein [bacterium]|nr:DUF4111 domain-containing protein [bacterium]